MENTTTETVWETLSKIDVSEHIEKKMGLSYVSWSWAWAMVKKIYPHAKFWNESPKANPDLNYFTDGKTAWVSVTVEIEDEKITESLPVMNFKNQSIALNAITSMDVNKAQKRCLVKALALFGLGLNVYAGEDLPVGEDSTETQTTQTTTQTQPSNNSETSSNLAGNVQRGNSGNQTKITADYLMNNYTSILGQVTYQFPNEAPKSILQHLSDNRGTQAEQSWIDYAIQVLKANGQPV